MNTTTLHAGRGPRRDLAKEASWRRTLEQFAASGTSVRDFCRAHGLKESLFYAWRRTLRQRTPAPAFVPLLLGPPPRPTPEPSLFLELRHGRVLRLPPSLPADRLAALIRALEEAA